jgi:hypothetical protein
MVRDPVIERLAQQAVDRCRERIVSATKRIEQGLHRNGEKGIQKELPSFTDALKRFRGL